MIWINAGMVEVQTETGYMTTWSKGVYDEINYNVGRN